MSFFKETNDCKCHMCEKREAIIALRGNKNRSCSTCGNEMLFCGRCLLRLKKESEVILSKE